MSVTASRRGFVFAIASEEEVDVGVEVQRQPAKAMAVTTPRTNERTIREGALRFGAGRGPFVARNTRADDRAPFCPEADRTASWTARVHQKFAGTSAFAYRDGSLPARGGRDETSEPVTSHRCLPHIPSLRPGAPGKKIAVEGFGWASASGTDMLFCLQADGDSTRGRRVLPRCRAGFSRLFAIFGVRAGRSGTNLQPHPAGWRNWQTHRT